MSHLVILRDENGNEYPYFPPHNDLPEGGRLADVHGDIIPFVRVNATDANNWKANVKWGSREQVDKWKAKAVKSPRIKDLSDCPKYLLDMAKEVFG